MYWRPFALFAVWQLLWLFSQAEYHLAACGCLRRLKQRVPAPMHLAAPCSRHIQHCCITCRCSGQRRLSKLETLWLLSYCLLSDTPIGHNLDALPHTALLLRVVGRCARGPDGVVNSICQACRHKAQQRAIACCVRGKLMRAAPEAATAPPSVEAAKHSRRRSGPPHTTEQISWPPSEPAHPRHADMQIWMLYRGTRAKLWSMHAPLHHGPACADQNSCMKVCMCHCNNWR